MKNFIYGQSKVNKSEEYHLGFGFHLFDCLQNFLLWRDHVLCALRVCCMGLKWLGCLMEKIPRTYFKIIDIVDSCTCKFVYAMPHWPPMRTFSCALSRKIRSWQPTRTEADPLPLGSGFCINGDGGGMFLCVNSMAALPPGAVGVLCRKFSGLRAIDNDAHSPEAMLR